MSGLLEASKNNMGYATGPRVELRPPQPGAPPVSPALLSLAQRVFFSSESARRRVLFVSPDAESSVADLGAQIAAVVATKATVALVDARMDQAAIRPKKKPAGSVRSTNPWFDFQTADRFWKVPFQMLFELEKPLDGRMEYPVPFDHVVFTSQIDDGLTALFCSMCDAAVLVLSAGLTRKDVARNAKHTLQQMNVELIGAVLSNRTFPTPESVYRRL
jgi:hypothetical protein